MIRVLYVSYVDGIYTYCPHLCSPPPLFLLLLLLLLFLAIFSLVVPPICCSRCRSRRSFSSDERGSTEPPGADVHRFGFLADGPANTNTLLPRFPLMLSVLSGAGSSSCDALALPPKRIGQVAWCLLGGPTGGPASQRQPGFFLFSSRACSRTELSPFFFIRFLCGRQILLLYHPQARGRRRGQRGSRRGGGGGKHGRGRGGRERGRRRWHVGWFGIRAARLPGGPRVPASQLPHRELIWFQASRANNL